MSDTVQQIKERLSIAEVVGSYIKLEKAGVNLKARCPFHNEKTPSFVVSPVRNSFYCFGCAEKGDMFSFVEKFEGVDFMGALKILADKAGVAIVFESVFQKSERDIIFKILEKSATYFEKNLKENEKALLYLKNRGLTTKTIEEFKIGYAVNDWRNLVTYLRNNGFQDRDVEKSGLIKKSDENSSKDFYDRFRGRIVFPISESSGRIIAFSGRLFDGKEESDGAKYINSPETEVFSKSNILFGYDKAKNYIRKWGFTIVVEGQFDLVMSHQAGFRNTVALSGTALTKEHLSLIERLSDKLVLALDNDEAGLRASGKSAALALSNGFDVKVAKLSGGKDPADLVKEDPEKWKKAVREATHIIDFYMDILMSLNYEKRKFGKEVSRLILPYVANVRSPIEKAHFIKKIASKLGVEESTISDEIRLIEKMSSQTYDYQETPNKEEEFEEDIITKILNELYGIIEAEKEHKKNRFIVNDIEDRLNKILTEGEFSKITEYDSLTSTILFEGEKLYEEKLELLPYVDELLLKLRYHLLRMILESTMVDLKNKEALGAKEDLSSLLTKCQKLSQEISAIDLILKK